MRSVTRAPIRSRDPYAQSENPEGGDEKKEKKLKKRGSKTSEATKKK